MENNKIWMRLGADVYVTEEEAKTLLTDEKKAGDLLLKLFQKNQIRLNGESYIPEPCIAQYNQEHGTDYPEEDVEIDVIPLPREPKGIVAYGGRMRFLVTGCYSALGKGMKELAAKNRIGVKEYPDGSCDLTSIRLMADDIPCQDIADEADKELTAIENTLGLDANLLTSAGYSYGFEEDIWDNLLDDEERATIAADTGAYRGDLHKTAVCMANILKRRGFNNPADSSGFFDVLATNGTNRVVEAYKSNRNGTEHDHYVIYCGYEDGDANFKYTKDLSVESLVDVLKEVAESEPSEKEEQ